MSTPVNINRGDKAIYYQHTRYLEKKMTISRRTLQTLQGALTLEAVFKCQVTSYQVFINSSRVQKPDRRKPGARPFAPNKEWAAVASHVAGEGGYGDAADCQQTKSVNYAQAGVRAAGGHRGEPRVRDREALVCTRGGEKDGSPHQTRTRRSAEDYLASKSSSDDEGDYSLIFSSFSDDYFVPGVYMDRILSFSGRPHFFFSAVRRMTKLASAKKEKKKPTRKTPTKTTKRKTNRTRLRACANEPDTIKGLCKHGSPTYGTKEAYLVPGMI